VGNHPIRRTGGVGADDPEPGRATPRLPRQAQQVPARDLRDAVLVVADTREHVADLNQEIRERLVAAGQVDDSRVLVTDSGERIGVGDRVATRRNDYDLNVANRDTWTVIGVRDDGTMHLVGTAGTRKLPPRYAVHYVELAYASTAYGAQGETTRTAHLALGEHTRVASAYVAMTRGRKANTAHRIAEDLEDARQRGP
jgi:exodeoxyribonuclease V alpha subunit